MWYLNPPAVVRDVLILGQAIDDSCDLDTPKGVVPAFHARTGEFMWKFVIVPTDPNDPAMKTYSNGTENVGAGNAWAPLSGDNELGLVYLPTSSANIDHMGTHRIGDNHYCNSLVALNVSNGEIVWFRQFVHHDVFDYDINNQPIVGEITRDGKRRKVIIQGTKMGFIFVLDATNGEPVFGIKEQPVPSFSEVPGEILSPTQPFPIDDFLRLAKTSIDLRPGKDLWGRTSDQEQTCVDFINSSGVDPIGEIYSSARISKPSLWIPGVAGGMNLGGSVALNTDRSIVVAATQTFAYLYQLLPKNSSSVPSWCQAFKYKDSVGVPFADCYGVLKLKERCYEPPWGELHAVDLTNGRKLWSVPHGTTSNFPESTEDDGSSWYSGGILVTAGGIVIAGNTDDRHLRVFNIDTGELLYKSPDPMAGMGAGNPITYRIDGKQYIVLTAGGNNFFGMFPYLSDHVYAFTLP
ncbi:unnamed protein product [Owenia fusiformis]|uniref:Pyrrolo-quinoline quinone repeat domain-containing protein n=1 Tax=Owenia fusiformis TaxID=6347 RepID=A0A8S4Q3X4_OWEFU|nr:unnamed protein product [Owenia fusiformis]